MKWYHILMPWRRYEEEHAKAEKKIEHLNKVVEGQQPEVNRMQANLERRLKENHFTLSWEELMRGRNTG